MNIDIIMFLGMMNLRTAYTTNWHRQEKQDLA